MLGAKLTTLQPRWNYCHAEDNEKDTCPNDSTLLGIPPVQALSFRTFLAVSRSIALQDPSINNPGIYRNRHQVPQAMRIDPTIERARHIERRKIDKLQHTENEQECLATQRQHRAWEVKLNFTTYNAAATCQITGAEVHKRNKGMYQHDLKP